MTPPPKGAPADALAPRAERLASLLPLLDAAAGGGEWGGAHAFEGQAYAVALQDYYDVSPAPWELPPSHEPKDVDGARAYLTWYLREEHFCGGSLSGRARDGSLFRAVRALCHACEVDPETAPVGFWRAEGPYGALSNWDGAPFEYVGVRYPTVEHFIMRAKVAMMGDREAMEKIERCGTPAEAKALGRGVKHFDPELWERAREEVAVAGIRARFQQDPRALALLMATGDRLLVECSPTDAIWGVGVAEEDPAWRDPAC